MDYDWIIVGSGFGGSVSALRLAEKGYRVAVIEAGQRFEDEDSAESTWQLNKFLWAPFLGLRGIFCLTPFRDVFVASGAGVGQVTDDFTTPIEDGAETARRAGRWKRDHEWSCNRARAVAILADGIREHLDEYLDFAWASPGPGFVNCRSKASPTSVEKGLAAPNEQVSGQAPLTPAASPLPKALEACGLGESDTTLQ